MPDHGPEHLRSGGISPHARELGVPRPQAAARLARQHIPTTPLIASGPFAVELPARRVAAAIARGLQAGGLPAPDIFLIDDEGEPGAEVRALLEQLGFDERMRRARAVVVAQWRLQQATLASSVAFEIATRARQAGVPAYAVTGDNGLDRFDARILDLQAILEASDARTLTAAGTRLARLI
jgi:glycerate kinase